MVKSYTISLHNGTKWSRQHNIRGAGLAKKEAHIDPNGYHKSFIDVPLRESYYQTFGQAVLEYNAKQTRSDRRITDYLTKVKEEHKRSPSKKPHASYEMILTIGNREHHPSVKRAEEVAKTWLDEFQKRNPNVVVFGAYFHADEPDSAPHMHVDYYYVKRENKRGLSLQVSQNGALNEQGYFPRKEDGKFVTPQTQFQRDSRELLRSISKEKGLIVEEQSGQREQRKHLDTDLFKKQTELNQVEKELADRKRELEQARKQAQTLESRVEKARFENETLTKQNQLLEMGAPKEMQLGILREENARLKRSLSLLQRAFNVVERVAKAVILESGQGLWDSLKKRLFKTLDEHDYNEFQSVRHDPELFGKESKQKAIDKRLGIENGR